MSGSLRFDRLRVRRMPGIDSEYGLGELAPGLNVIHGPNASGKTTTARALEALLWPRDAAPPRASLRGALVLGDDTWSVDLDAGRARWQRNGLDADPPAGIPPAASRDCYRFPLHELIVGVDRRLADEILRVSAGGYDLEAAAAALGARDGASRSAAAHKKAYDDARARLDEARRKQAELREEELRVDALAREAAEAEAAERRTRLLERALAYARAAAEAERARAAFEAYPEAMRALRGDEAARVAELRRRIEAARAALEQAGERRREALAELEGAGLPEGGVAASEVAALRARHDHIRELERIIEANSRELAAATKKRDEERRALGDDVDEARLAAIDAGTVAALETFAEWAEAVRAERAVVRAELALAGEGDVPTDLERVRRAVDLLRAWLRAPGPSAREAHYRRLALAAAVALGLAGVAGGVSGVPLLWLAAVAGVAAALLAASGRRGADRRAVHREELERLGLGVPAAWEPAAVEEFLERLTERLDRGREAEREARRRAELQARLARLEEAWAELEARRGELAARLGVAPDASAPRLAWLCTRISRWQDANREVAALAAAIEEARSQHAAALREAAARLAPYRYAGQLADGAALKAAIDDLDLRRGRHDAAVAALRDAERAREELARAIAEHEAERRSILERLGLDGLDEEGAERVVADWCREFPAYVAARDRRVSAEGAAAQARSELERTEGFAAELLGRTEDEVADALEEARRRAGELQRIRDEITAIRTRVEGAKRAHDVEEALAGVERCREELRRAREADTVAAIAAALVDHVRGVTRDAHLPQVFLRARALFREITRGRYRLDFSPGDRSFRATDTVTGVGHALDELSSATRVHLLMAVRIAFVEEQETAGVRLPLVFDETLGNSDDARAEAIMDAILTLAANGRQVFYFTAQPDEVAKWRAMLQRRPEVPASFIDLAHVRRIAAHAGFEPFPAAEPPGAGIPAPRGMTHEEYGRSLLVPALDPERGVGAVHLWYLIEDVDALYRALRLGVERWGALRALVEGRGSALLDPDGAVYARAEAAARALERAFDLARIGRGRKVDRAVLADSRAVSDTFLDRVAELCEECGGDARGLVAALARGEVRRFRADALEKLRDYLEEHGYLDEREPLTSKELRLRTLAAVAPELARGLITPERVAWLLAHAARAWG